MASRRTAHLRLADRLLAVEARQASSEARRALPSAHGVRILIDDALELLFPGVGRLGAAYDRSAAGLRAHLASTASRLQATLEEATFLCLHHRAATGGQGEVEACRVQARRSTRRLMGALPRLRTQLMADVRAAYEYDPAATGLDEVVACYPGLFAISTYRVAHDLLQAGAIILPRMLTEHAHSRTGIDIHPGARIGRSFFIDHGTGIVVGETTVIGDRVRIYQGVTLGALSVRSRARLQNAGGQRHPTIEDDVIIYANATILGGDTVIGRGAVVGGNAWITYSVPAGVHVGVGT